MYRKLAIGAVIAAVVTLGTVSSAAAADHTAAPSTAPQAAACHPDFIGTGIRIHTAPTLGSAVVGEGNGGDCVSESGEGQNAIVGDPVDCGDGRTDLPYWTKLTDLRTGVTGYVSNCFIID